MFPYLLWVSTRMIYVGACAVSDLWKSRKQLVKSVLPALTWAPGIKLRLPDLCGKFLYPLGHPGTLFNIKQNDLLRISIPGEALETAKTDKHELSSGIFQDHVLYKSTKS